MKKIFQTSALLGVFALALVAGASQPAIAGPDHSEFIEGPFKTGPAVTATCLECHEEHAEDFMKTTHWTWSQEQTVNGKKVNRGKKDAINNFCTSIESNWPRCTSCHAGYNWEDASFDFSNPSNIDCLVCHDTTGTYLKESTEAGRPFKNVNLLKVAQNVGAPTRFNCGTCHFYGGGGDAVKHGDLDSSLEYPSRSVDVHMDTDSNDFSCQECHQTEAHAIPGNSLGVSPGGQNHFDCSTCHTAEPHEQSRLNQHAAKVSCQACHIPYFAKEVPTKLEWDWSTAGGGHEDIKDELGMHGYSKKKGHFKWGKMVAPEYAWYNGEGGAYTKGEKIDPTQVTKLAYPLGSIDDENAKIYPFKVHRGKQIYDAKNKTFLTTKLHGEGGFWTEFDWDKAARLGTAASGMDYSGEYGFAPTEMYWRINHMVSTKQEALGCLDCHGDNGRLDWQALDYKVDPMDAK